MLKKKPPSGGAPEWVLTYGDMMSLLLCFFILLAAFANFEDPGTTQKAIAALESIKEALGMQGQAGNLPDNEVDFHSMIRRLESLVKPDQPKNRGDATEEGIYGRNFRVRRIRDGMEITVGGPILFEPFSAKLTDEGREMIGRVGDELRGKRNKVEVCGHAAEEPRPADWTYDDAMKLSYSRAETVANALILRGVDPRTLRLVAVGPNEPVAQRVYDLEQRGQNRRVEIVVRESLIDDYVGTDPAVLLPVTKPAD